MCYIQGTYDTSTNPGSFIVRIAAFGESSDRAVHGEQEHQLHLGKDVPFPIQVAITAPLSDNDILHAITLSWGRIVEAEALRGILGLIPGHLGGLKADTEHLDRGASTQPKTHSSYDSWNDVVEDLVESFLSAQKRLLDFAARDASDPELTNLRDLGPGRVKQEGVVWISRNEPEKLELSHFKNHFQPIVEVIRDFYEPAEEPDWFSDLRGDEGTFFLNGIFGLPPDLTLANRDVARAVLGVN